MRRFFAWGVLGLFALAISGCFFISAPLTVEKTLLVPFYVYPSWWDPDVYLWDDLAAAGDSARIWAIINPASGPGGPPNEDYQRGLSDIRGHVTILGYVWTNYGQKSLDEVKTEIDVYANEFVSFGLQGIFLDGVASSADYLSYYEELVAYAKGRGLSPVVLNPGTTIDEAYLRNNVGDVIVIFDDAYQALPGWEFPEYLGRYPPEKFGALVYATPEDAFLSVLSQLDQRGFAFVYVTDDDLPNPWDRLPTYWSRLLSVLSPSGQGKYNAVRP
ncbi:spherulation-specific family 4 protein [Candidatus Bipolaricaulota bacterium]|nr:spherulation-specific family 4 protein [Candidatus Bipolaricaulota bacterium]